MLLQNPEIYSAESILGWVGGIFTQFCYEQNDLDPTGTTTLVGIGHRVRKAGEEKRKEGKKTASVLIYLEQAWAAAPSHAPRLQTP